MRDEEEFRTILRKIREIGLELSCSVFPVDPKYPENPKFEVTDAEMATLGFTDTEEQAALLRQIFEWLIDEAEYDQITAEIRSASDPKP